MTIRAIYRHGVLRLSKKLRLKENQPVLVDIHLLTDDLPSATIASLAAKSKSYDFLDNPAEDVYSLKDGKSFH